MKKYCNILTAVLALCLLSCAKETPVEVEQTDLPPVEEYDPWLAHPREVPSIPGPGPELMAGNSTKSQLVQDGEDHYDVQWTAGDTFYAIGVQPPGSEHSLYGAQYSTTDGGTEAEFTSMYGLGDPVELHAIYPYSQFLGITDVYVDEVEYLGLCIEYPTVQTATPGSVAEGANLSYAHPGSLSEKLGFTNLVSIIKFHLEGSQASAVTSVTFRGMNNCAGAYVLYYRDGRPRILTNVEVGGTSKSRTVTLQGTFAAGQDYYIAITPSRQEAFSMIFANADGETTTLTSTTEMKFNRSQINDFGTITINGFTDTPGTEPLLYMSASVPYVKPVSLVVVPDGYTADELDDYEMQAKAAMGALFNTEPFKSYRDYFNVWILKVASNESGANITDGNGNILTPVDCYFGSKWGATTYNDLSANDSKVFNFVSDNCPDLMDGSHTLAEVPILVIINDTRYAGIAHTWSNGQTYCQVPTTAGHLSWDYPSRKARTDDLIPNPSLEEDLIDTPATELAEVGSNTGTWLNTTVHEFGGHSFARLADEYWYDFSFKTDFTISAQSWPVPFSLNVSTDPANPIWKDVLLDSYGNVRDELKAKSPLYAQRIGAFQGGDVSPFNRWRSERISCMIDNRFYFSTYQRYLIVQRIHTLAGDYISDPEERFADFLAKDVAEDPVRDVVSSAVYGVSNAVPPRPVPMLPPPRMMD